MLCERRSLRPIVPSTERSPQVVRNNYAASRLLSQLHAVSLPLWPALLPRRPLSTFHASFPCKLDALPHHNLLVGSPFLLVGTTRQHHRMLAGRGSVKASFEHANAVDKLPLVAVRRGGSSSNFTSGSCSLPREALTPAPPS